MLLVPSAESFVMGAVLCEVTCIPTHKTAVLLPLVWFIACVILSMSVLPDGLALQCILPLVQDLVGTVLPPWWLCILQGQDTFCNLCRAHVLKLLLSSYCGVGGMLPASWPGGKEYQSSCLPGPSQVGQPS